MSLSSSTLAAIQKVGAAAFVADEKLKKEVKEYADRVNAAISANAYTLGTDTLIENWKLTARLQQTLMGIEQELKKVYAVAADLASDDQPVVRDLPTLATPKTVTKKSDVKKVATAPAPVKVVANKKVAKPAAVPAKASAKVHAESEPNLAPSDVKVKPKKAPAAPKAKPAKVKTPVASGKNMTLGPNPVKLLAYFARTLNTNDFSAVNQTMTAQETGIPLGSMTAALKRLLETGRILSGPNGSLKLAAAEPVASPDAQTALAE